MTPDDARAALETALPCYYVEIQGSADRCADQFGQCKRCRYRAAVWPILQGLVEKFAAAGARCESEQELRLSDGISFREEIAELKRQAEGERTYRMGELHKLADDYAAIQAKLAAVEAERDASESTLAMTVARLGGMVEGRPTARHNFLQRVDELRELDAERWTATHAIEAKLVRVEAERDKLSDKLFEAERNCEAWKTVGDNIGKQRAELREKLAQAEAERDHWAECNTEWAETATKHAVHIAELEEKLAQAEALLKRRPHCAK